MLRSACWTDGCPDIRQRPVGEPAATAAFNFDMPRWHSSLKRFCPVRHGTDIRIIQVLLGHNNLSSTAFYTQVATHTIRATQSPLDRLSLEVMPPG